MESPNHQECPETEVLELDFAMISSLTSETANIVEPAEDSIRESKINSDPNYDTPEELVKDLSFISMVSHQIISPDVPEENISGLHS